MSYKEHNPDYQYNHQDGMIAGVPQGKPMAFEQADGKNPNPFYNKRRADGKLLYGYDTNCQTCVVAYEARRRGFDVRALPNLKNPYIRDLKYNTSLAYVDQNGNPPKYISRGKRERIYDFIDKTVKNGERYTVEFGWGRARDGHIISVERDAGGIKIYDPQTGKVYSNRGEINRLLFNTRDHRILRVDNLRFNDQYIDYILKGGK